MAIVTIIGALAGCDRNDGREMDPPSSYARFQLQSTTPSTTTTVAPPPTEATTATSSTTTTTAAQASTSSTSGADPIATPDSAADSGPAGSGTDGGVLGFPDLAADGVVFTAPWEPGAAIDAAYTCDGGDLAPPVTWTAPPEGTAELALTVVDEDAGGYIHWLVIGLPAEAGGIGGDTPIEVGAEATNTRGDAGWAGPCPPEADDPHTYRFTLHALTQATELPADAPAADLQAAIDASTMAVATFTATYQRA
jgi:Raf kinase inhibitor-like YbhB/YbcL family protein